MKGRVLSSLSSKIVTCPAFPGPGGQEGILFSKDVDTFQSPGPPQAHELRHELLHALTQAEAVETDRGGPSLKNKKPGEEEKVGVFFPQP